VRAIRFVPDAWEAYLYWHGQDKKTLKRLNSLIEATARDPFSGIGKPEALRGDLSGYCR
jgi:toxin YoeB